jgi:type IX secretion system PorP/SprF family membrane protein
MRKLSILILFLITQDGISQFNSLQSQYLLDPLQANPAYAGSPGFLSTTLSYRRQWWGFDGSPENYSFTAHTPLRNPHQNTGLIISQENVSVLHKTRIEILYAYRIIAKRFSFAAGFSPGISLLRNNWNEIQTISGNDGSFQSSEASTAFESGYGLYFNTKRFFLGVSGNSIFSGKGQPTVKDQPFLAYTGYTLGKQENFSLTISVLGRYLLNSYYQADFNLMSSIHDRISIGASYRTKDALVGILQFRLNEQFQLGYSYDFTLSRLRNYSSGTHELVLRYDFHYRVNAKSPRTL